MVLGSTQPLTQMSNKAYFLGGVGVKADNLATFMCRASGKSGSLNIQEPFTSRMQKGGAVTTASTCSVFCVR